MKGKWIGKYWYSGKVPDFLKNRKTEFEIVIEDFQNSKVLGKVSDNLETGGTSGVGSISGEIKGNNIKFTKIMPVKTTVFEDGTKLEEEKPHRPIYYSGIIDTATNSIKGTWKFKKGIGFINGRLVIYPGTKGEWEMKRA